jgi:antitoxin component HigA of HigAB toxin-antitoxin module
MQKKTVFEQFAEKPHQKRMLSQERLLLEVTETLCDMMKRRGVSRADLATQLGKSKSFITQVLSGGRNMTLRTLADFAWALDHRLKLSAVPEVSWVSVSLNKEEGEALFRLPGSFLVARQYHIVPAAITAGRGSKEKSKVIPFQGVAA